MMNGIDFYSEVEALYEALDDFVRKTGLAYDVETDSYKMANTDGRISVDDDMLASIENAHADINYFLCK